MSLIHWWPLNGDTKDYGVNNVNPTLHGTVSYLDTGKIGKTVKFNGSLYFDTSIQATNTMSFAFWVYPDSASAWTDMFSIGTNLGRIEITSTTNYTYNWYQTSNGGNNLCNSGYIFTLGNQQWYHIVMTVDGTNVKFYVNGELKATTAQTGQLTSAMDDNLITWGRRGVSSSNIYYARYNDIRIYNHALSAKEVKEISKGLVLHYDFNDPYVEGTTNIDPSKTSISNWSDGGGVVSYVVGDYFGKQCYKFTMNKTSTSTVWSYMNCNPLTQGAAVGNTVTRSCLMYIPGGQTLPGWFKESIEGNSTNKKFVQYDYTKPNTWQRVSMTGTIADTGTNGYLHYFIASGATVSNFVWYMCDFQLEIKDHPTPYVNGTRSAGTIFDSSGYGYNGTQQGGGIQIVSDSACGKYSANIVNTYISSPCLYLSECTILFWFKRNSLTGTRQFIYTGWPGISIELTTSNTWQVYYTINSSYSTVSIPISTTLQANIWYHIAFVIGSTGNYSYVNGAQTGTSSYTVPYYDDTFRIGSYASYVNFDAKIADFKIYSTPLSSSDILAEYNKKASIDKSGILFTSEFEESDAIPNIDITKTSIIKCNNIVEGTDNVKLVGGYTQLEYLESSGTQIIDTNYILTSNNFIFEDVYEYAALTNSEACIGGTSTNFEFGNSASVFFNYITGKGSAYGPGTPAINTIYNYKAIVSSSDYICEINGVQGAAVSHSKNFVGEKIWINRYYSNSHQLNGKQYSVRIWDDGILVRDFIPAKRNSDNVLGMYDLVERKFYTNAGTGTFTAGPEIGNINAIYAKEIKEI